jgi:hypothetical protein
VGLFFAFGLLDTLHAINELMNRPWMEPKLIAAKSRFLPDVNMRQ